MITKRLLVFMITLCLLSSFSYAWWNTSWPYKQLINISNRAQTLTDYQVRLYISNLTVGKNFNWSNGGNDLRFLNSTQDGLYNYWIEKWNATTKQATIYIKIGGTFTNNTNKIIYMYYRNNAASRASTTSILTNIQEDMERTYARDHFGYELVGTASKWQFGRNATLKKEGSYSVKFNLTGGNYGLIYMNNTWTNTTAGNGVLDIQIWGRTSAVGEQDYVGFCFNFNPKTKSGYCPAYGTGLDSANNWRTRIIRYDNGVPTEVLTGGTYPGDRFDWTKIRSRMNSAGSWNITFYDSTNATLVTETLTGYTTYQTGGIAIFAWSGTLNPTPMYYDDIRLNSGYGKQTQLALPLMGTILGNEFNISSELNSAPTVTAYLLPATIYFNETLRAQCNGTDIDLDNLTYNYWLYKNGTLMYSGSTPKTSVKNITNLTVNTIWRLNCTAFDGNLTSTMSTTTRSIAFNWWNTDWKYRQKINIKNRASSTITDYEFRVDLNNISTEVTFNWSNGGKDLRFTSYNNTILYKYWIEKWNSTTKQATIYVDVNGSFATNEVKSIYMYYGKPGATANTTILALNTFFEDGERSYLSDHFYKLTVNNSQITRSAMYLNGSYSLKINVTPGANTIYYMNNSWTNTTGKTLTLEYYGTTIADGSFVGLCFNFNPKTISGYCAGLNDNVGTTNWRSRLDVWVNGSIFWEKTDLFPGDRRNWTKVISKINTNTGSWNATYTNQITPGINISTTTNINVTLFKSGGIALYGYSRTGFPTTPIYFDGMKLRDGWAYQTQLILPTPNVTLGDATSQEEVQGINYEPTATATILPTIIYSNDTLRAYCNGSDTNNLTIRFYYKLYVNAILNITGLTTYKPLNTQISVQNITSKLLYPGDKWSLRCIANDGELNSTEAVKNVTISNFQSTITNSRLSPTIAYTNNTLYGYCTGFDIDKQTMYYDYTVFRNNINISSGTFTNETNLSTKEKLVTTILPASTTVGDIFKLSCRMRDSYPSKSNWLNSSGITILNSPPVIVNVGVSPLHPFDNTILYSSCNVTDNDGGATYVIKWYENITTPLISIHTGNNLTANYTKIGTTYTTICNATDGINFTIKQSNTVNISTSFNLNYLQISPQYPIRNVNNINCSFRVISNLTNEINVSITWFNSTDLNIWQPVTIYDYTFSNITKNVIYTTNIGTGSIPSTYKDYTHWKCQASIDMLGVSTVRQNSSIVNIYPTEGLTIYSPANNTKSKNILTTTFRVIDYDNSINCSLRVNDSIVTTNVSTRNWTLTTLTYNPPTNDYYNWYIYCHSNQNSQFVQSGRYNFLYDNTPPTYTNYYNGTSKIYPQIGDIVNLSVDITDNFEINVCKLQIKDDKTGWRNQSTFTINDNIYDLNTTFTVRNVSTANNSYVYWSVWCNDTSGNSIASNIKFFNVTDITFPMIINSPSNIFYNTNKTVISGRLYDLYYNFTYFDYNLFQAEVNITCEKSGQIHYWHVLNISTTNFTIVNSTDLQGLPPQKCTIFTASSDDHTKKAIPNYEVTNLVKGLKFKTEHNNIISVIDNDLTIDDKITTSKQKDRYKFDMNFKNKKLLLNYTIVSNNPIYFRTDSSFPAHFVIWNENISAGNWIDFNVKKVNNQEGNIKNKDRNYRITKISDNEYNILIMPNIPLDEIEGFVDGVDDLFTFNFSTRENRNLISKYGIGDIEFESIGGTTITNASYGFYIGGDVNISTLNVYDNGTYVNNFTLQVTTLDSYPGFNGTFNILGNTEVLENISNGSYRLDFSSGRYFSKSYIINIVNSSQDIVYRTFQGVVFVSARNVKTLVPVYGTSGTVNNTVTNFITHEANTDNTTGFLDFYLNASKYNLTFNAPGYLPFNDSFILAYKQNLSITFNLSFYVTFYFVDERTLEGFNMSSPDAMRFILYCTSSTYTTLLTPSNTSQATGIPITCNYDKFKFVLEYPATSYYRTLIYPSTYFNNSFNITVYLIDLRTTTAVVNTFILDDLLQQYDNPAIYVKKIINDASELITSDYIDIENKITAYLIQNHEYILEVWSDNNPIRTIGVYSADNAGDKIVRVYDIDLEANPESGIVNDVYVSIMNTSINGSPYIVATYNDLNNETTSVTFNVYTNKYNGTLVYTNTVPGAYDIEFLYNYSQYINDTLYPEIVYNYPGYDTQRVSKQINVQGFSIRLPLMDYVSEEFIGWFLTIVLSVLAIMATAKTANVMTLVIMGISALFIIFGWYPLAWGAWAVVLFIALLSMFKEGEKAIP